MKKSQLKEGGNSSVSRGFRAPGILAVCALLLVQVSWAAPAVERQTIHNTVPAAVASAKNIRPALRLEKLNLAISLPLRNKEQLTNLLAQIYDRSSPNYHHYLTPAQFTDQFSPTAQDYDAVIQFARAHGLTVTTKNANRTVLGVRGTVLDIEKAMHVSLNEYQHPTENRTFHAPDREPTLDLAVPVLFIHGLDNFSIPKPLIKTSRLEKIPAGGLAAPVAKGSPAGGVATPNVGSGYQQSYLPEDIRAAYLPNSTLTGGGQSIGVLELDAGFYQADINSFESADNIGNVPVVTVLLDGYNGGEGSANGSEECALDIEQAMGVAPGAASIYCYEGSDPDDILASMASQNTCSTFGCSWGWNYPGDPSPDQSFLQMAAQGQSFFCAAGDGGAYTSNSADTPDGDPNVTMVGGTVLTTSGPIGTWTGESAWLDGGGGFISGTALPSWQQGIATSANHGSTTYRNVPDVSACAENVTIYCLDGEVGAVDGTSCSTPMWAGFVANANQLAVANGQPLVGFLNPAIYNLGQGLSAYKYTSVMHDITSGNNGSATEYPAVTGYDLATGWGSPATTNLLSFLGLSEPLSISSFSPVSFNGPVGGPFTPSSVTYTIANNSTVALNWSLPTPPSWLDVSPLSGTLPPGGAPTTVTLSLDPSATNLVTGAYTYEVAFTDLNDSFVQTQPATLGVDSAPVISLQPTNEALLVGMTASFTVTAATNGLIYYQWQENGANLANNTNISGVTTPTLTISNLTTGSAGSYSVIVSNALGEVDSSNAVLTIVSSQPVVVAAPTNTTILPGGNAVFTVSAVGNTPYTYRWYFNGNHLAQTSKYGNTTNSPALVITNCVGTNVGSYFVTVSNSFGVTTSSVALLSLTPVTVTNVTLYQNAAYGAPFTAGRLTATGPENPYSAVTYYGGAYYGTSFNGGAATGGTVYSVTPAGVFSVKDSFNGTNDGYGPVGSLCLANNGLFYGSCGFWGLYYNGTLVQISGTGFTTMTAITQFGGANGSEPVSGLMQATDGNLYGCANAGGLYNYGTVFRQAISPASLTNLVSFNGFNGAYPSPVLIQATDGNLYGTTESGGDANGDGTIFKISTNGALTVVAMFDGSNGRSPVAGLIQASDGNFYGTALQGGDSTNGTVFQMLADGTINTLYSFTGGADGSQPWAGLVQGTNGNLYGTTQAGGTYGDGTVFQISLSGSLTTIAQFDGLQGSTPEGNLVQGPDGNLYGTCFSGGYLGFGSFYSISNSGPLAISGQPVDLTVNSGATAFFSVATTGNNATYYQWQEDGTNLVNGGQFSGVNTYALVISNSLTANAGVYSVIISNVYNSVTSSPASLSVAVSPPTISSEPESQTNVVGSTVLFSVAATGDLPLTYQWQANGANLTDGAGIFGSATPLLTLSNLPLSANGTVYTVVLSNSVAVVSSSPAILTVAPVNPLSSVTVSNTYVFTDGTNGAAPAGSLIQGKDGFLYGTASEGGTNLQGNIFRATLSGNVTNLYSFPYLIADGYAPNGASPFGGLVQSTIGTNLYGTCLAGGPNDPGAAGYGTLFRLTNFTSITALYDFTDGSDGAQPASSLVQGKDGNFYGTAYSAGADSAGTIFKLSTNGTFTVIYTFTGTSDGANPQAALIQGSDGNLYGTTTGGGDDDYGTAFKVTTNGTFKLLATFTGYNGAYLLGGLIQGKDGNFYGTTLEGGANGYGTVFQLNTNTGVKTLYSFAGTDGANPSAGVIQGKDGNLYGTTAAGGPGSEGSVFLITTNGALTTLLWFDGFNGADPQAALLQANDGNLYGTVSQGGPGFNPTTGEGGWGSIVKVILPAFFTNTITNTAIAGLPFSASLVPQTAVPVGDSVTYSLVSGPSWLTLTTHGLISGTPASSNVGTDIFVVKASDTNGYVASTNLDIIVKADPAPTFSPTNITEPFALAGTAYVGSIATNATALYATNGDVITFGLVSGPSWLGVSSSGALSGTPLAANAGTNVFVVSATDLGGSSNLATVTIFVDTAPVFTASVLTYATATAGLSYSGTLTTNVTDAAGSALTYSELSGPAWLTVASNGALSGTPAAINAGTNLFSVEAIDSYGLSATATVAITVIPDVPPLFLLNPWTGPAATAGVAYSTSIATNAYETNVQDTLTFAKVSGPTWLSIAANGAAAGTPYSVNGGTNTFVVKVTDLAGLSATGTLVVHVTATPIVATIKPQSGGFLLTWTGGVAPYQVLTSTNLSVPWQTLGSSTNATSVVLTNTGSGTFYQIQGN